MQHLHVPSQRQQERGHVHADHVLDTAPARREVHTSLAIPRRGRPEHVHVPMERFEERGTLHKLEVLDTTQKAQGKGPVLPGRIVQGLG